MEILHFISKDIKELVAIMVDHNVDFILVGGYAVGFHGHIRTTMDVDFLIRPSETNNQRMLAALTEFGFGNAGIDPRAFSEPGHMVTIGAKPNEVDFMTSLSGCSVEDIFANSVEGKVGDSVIKVIGLDDLVKNKQSASRPKDQIDIIELEAIRAMSRENRTP